MTHETDDTWPGQQEMPEQIFPFVFKKVSISLFQFEFEIEILECQKCYSQFATKPTCKCKNNNLFGSETPAPCKIRQADTI